MLIEVKNWKSTHNKHILTQQKLSPPTHQNKSLSNKKVINLASPVINFVVLHVRMISITFLRKLEAKQKTHSIYFSLPHIFSMRRLHLTRHNRNAKGRSRDAAHLSGNRRVVPNLSPMHPLSSKKKTPTP